MTSRKLGRVALLAALVLVLLPGLAVAQSKEIVLTWPCIWVGTDSKAPAVKEIVDKFNLDHAGSIEVVIEVSNRAHLERIRQAVRNLPGVLEVTRRMAGTTKAGEDAF